MKKILVVIVAMMLWLSGFATTIYVSTTGSDVTGNGTVGNPYASLYKAASVSVLSDLIHVKAGNYIQSALQILIPVGVSIEGEGKLATKISLTFSVVGSGGFNNAAIQFVSVVQNTNGNQSISNIWFDGSNFTCLNGLLVRARGNTLFNNVNFTNFGITALNFNGKTSETTGTPPSVAFSANNSVTNCSFFECSDRITQQANSISAGSICLAGQRNILFQYDTLSNTTKPIGHNGNLFGAVQGNNIGAKWLNNIMTKPPDDGASFNFGIESWYDQGGCIFAYNTYVGGGNTIDVGYGGANRGDSTYSWYVHDNIVPNPALLTSNTSQPVGSIFFQLEPSKNVSPGCPCSSIPLNATIGDAIVTNNYLTNVGTLVQITLNNFAGNFCDKVYINHNVMQTSGYANNTYSGVFNFTIALGTRIDSIFIDNNTLVSNTGAGFNKGILILEPNDGGAITDIYFRNNIAMNALGYGYLVFRGTNSCTRIWSQNNITFGNTFTNNPFIFGGAPPTPGPTFFNNTGNLKVDPLFISPNAPINYHLQAGSMGNNGGLNPPATYIGAYPPGTIVPTITWTPTSPIIYGTALGAAQLNATSGGVPGTFVYTPAAGTIPNAGTTTLSVVFIPTDQNTYSVVGATATLIVNQATATLSYSNLTQTYTGLPLAPTITTNPAGLTVVSTTYNGVGSTPINAGVYTVVSGLNNANYTASTITNTFTINKATATINLSNLNQTYDGTPKPVTTSTSPSGLTVISVTYNGSGIVPTNAGSYPIIVSLSNTNYSATNATGTLVIAKATPTVTWSNPSSIVFGTALSGTQLNASASVAGTFTYTPASGTFLNAGAGQILSVNFTPTDAANYNSVNNTTVLITVTKASATINVSNLTQFFDGNPKPVTVSTTPASLGVITTLYNGSPTVPSAVGSYSVNVTLNNSNYTASPFNGTLVISTSAANIFITNLSQVYTGSPLPVTVSTNPSGLVHTDTYNGSSTVPTNVGAYTVIATLNSPFTGADTQTLVISKATPVITWPTPSSISFGTALSGTQLNASANVAGSFVYTPASGTVLNVGSTILSTTFTPTDASNYNTVSATVPITVSNASATLTLSNLAQTYNGLQHPVNVVTSPVGLSGVTILYNGSSTPPTNAGSYTINVSLSNANYSASPISGILVVSKAIPTLSWTIPAAVQTGTILSGTQLNATSNIPGTFSYIPVAGTTLFAGTQSLTATFTPTDAVNYAVTTISVPLSVYGAPFTNWFIDHGGVFFINLPNQTPPPPFQ